jgi:hypothetical protein
MIKKVGVDAPHVKRGTTDETRTGSDGAVRLRHAPEWIRTTGLILRRDALYPAELRARCAASNCNAMQSIREANKPSSVSLRRRIISLGRQLPAASSSLPGIQRRGPRLIPAWPCSGWGLPCRSPLPGARWSLTPPFHPCLCRLATAIGGLLSAALSIALRRPAVSRHPALWSSDFPRAPKRPRSTLASRIVKKLYDASALR